MALRDRFGLHDEMGVGKTATCVRALDLIDAKRAVIIVPAMLRENWVKEIRRFSYRDNIRVCKAKNVHDFGAWAKGRFNYLVCSYEMATKWAPDLKEQFVDAVITDEAHYLKNSDAKRTVALLGKDCDGYGGAIEKTEHFWHVTGTAMANDPIDIYTFLRAMRATSLEKAEFTKRYFYSHGGAFSTRQTPREEMLPELRYVIGNNAIRRTKLDAGLNLPPIFLNSFMIDGNTDQISVMLREHPGLEQAIYAAVEQGGLSNLMADHLMTLRRLIGEAKAVPYARMLAMEIGAGYGKRVVYGIHKDALSSVHAILARYGIKSVLVNGETSEAKRVDAVQSFQEDPDCMAFIGNMRAAGTGLTLTAASLIDILESDWSPATNAQAIMRVHRIGQTNTVHGRFITLADSIDEVVNDIVVSKTSAIAQVDGNAMTAAPALVM